MSEARMKGDERRGDQEMRKGRKMLPPEFFSRQPADPGSGNPVPLLPEFSFLILRQQVTLKCVNCCFYDCSSISYDEAEGRGIECSTPAVIERHGRVRVKWERIEMCERREKWDPASRTQFLVESNRTPDSTFSTSGTTEATLTSLALFSCVQSIHSFSR